MDSRGRKNFPEEMGLELTFHSCLELRQMQKRATAQDGKAMVYMRNEVYQVGNEVH